MRKIVTYFVFLVSTLAFAQFRITGEAKYQLDLSMSLEDAKNGCGDRAGLTSFNLIKSNGEMIDVKEGDTEHWDLGYRAHHTFSAIFYDSNPITSFSVSSFTRSTKYANVYVGMIDLGCSQDQAPPGPFRQSSIQKVQRRVYDNESEPREVCYPARYDRDEGTTDAYCQYETGGLPYSAIDYYPSFSYTPIGNLLTFDNSIKITTYPVINKLTPNTTAGNNSVGEDEYIEIGPISGVESQYFHWWYKSEGTGSSGFYPPVMQGKNYIYIKASDLFGYLPDDSAGHDIVMRVYTGVPHAPESLVPVVGFRYIHSPPPYVNHSTTPTLCSDSTEGTITLKFNRYLEPNERFLMFLEKKLELTGTFGTVDNYTVTSTQFNTNNSNKTHTISGLGKGTYRLKYQTNDTSVSNKNTNAVEVIFTIDGPAPVVFNPSKVDVACKGDSTGRITVAATGGSGSYQYSQDGGTSWQTSNVFSNLKAGSYAILVKDSKECIAPSGIKTVTLIEPEKVLETSLVSMDEPLGFGLSNGNITTTASGGSPFLPPAAHPYTFLWNNGDTRQSMEGIKAGFYSLTVTDSHGCTAVIPTFKLTQPDLLVTTINLKDIVLCKSDANGSLTTKTTGGRGVYSYKWKKDGEPFSYDTDKLSELVAGHYALEVTDGNQNKATSEYTLTEPDLLEIDFLATAVTCGGGKDGTLTAIPKGGTTPYTYSWSNGETTDKLVDMYSGDFLVQVTDKNQCMLLKKGTVPSLSDLKATAIVKQNTCYKSCDGSIQLTVTGGSGDYSVVWPSIVQHSGLTANNLCVGDYPILIKDNIIGCNLPMNFSITQPDLFSIDLGADRNLCKDQTDLVQPTVQNEKWAYLWTSSNGFTATTPQVTLGQAGDYKLEVTNEQGCKASDTVKINQSDLVVESSFLVASQTYKNQDIILVNVSNQPNQTYKWLLPSEALKVSEDETTCRIKILSTGTYPVSLQVINPMGCGATTTKQLVVEEDPGLPVLGTESAFYIKEFLLYPNPTTSDGDFTVKIILSEKAPISLTLYQSASGILLDQKESERSKEHIITYYKTLPSGVYLIVLRTPTQVQSKQLIVK